MCLRNSCQQGPYSSYRLNQMDPNPLLAVVRKRLYHQQGKVHPHQHLYGAVAELVCVFPVLSEEDTCSAKKRRAEECFGTNPLPRLEKFTFKVRIVCSWTCCQ